MNGDTSMTDTYRLMKERGESIIASMERACEAPDEVNTDTLFKIIGDNKDTEYGRKNHFSDVKGIDDYRRMIPLTTFDDYAEMVYRELEGKYYVR